MNIGVEVSPFCGTGQGISITGNSGRDFMFFLLRDNSNCQKASEIDRWGGIVMGNCFESWQ